MSLDQLSNEMVHEIMDAGKRVAGKNGQSSFAAASTRQREILGASVFLQKQCIKCAAGSSADFGSPEVRIFHQIIGQRGAFWKNTPILERLSQPASVRMKP